MMSTAEGIQLWCCTDCLLVFANGENPPEMDDAALADWHARIDRNTDGYHVALGGDHDDDCPNMVDGEWDGSTDCSCEIREFSWSGCETCGSHLGGERHAVTLFPLEVGS